MTGIAGFMIVSLECFKGCQLTQLWAKLWPTKPACSLLRHALPAVYIDIVPWWPTDGLLTETLQLCNNWQPASWQGSTGPTG